MARLAPLTVLISFTCVACGSAAGTDAGMTSDALTPDAGALDGGATDAGSDAGTDAGTIDGGATTAVFPARDFVCAAGATPVCETTEPADTDAERTEATPGTLGGVTLAYVISRWSAPSAVGGSVVGLNRDGLDSGMGSTATGATCEEVNPDFTSPLDPAHVGVDNGLQALVTTFEGFLDSSTCPAMSTRGCIDAQVAEAITEGELLVVLELANVDDLSNDASVRATLHLAAVAGGGAPMLDGTTGALLPDQTFTSLAVLGTDAAADIFHGRLRLSLASYAWPAAVPVRPLHLPGLGSGLAEIELRFDVTSTGLENGVLSAHASPDEILATFGTLDAGMENVLRTLIDALSDIDPSAADPTVCQRVSVGYLLSAVSATL